MTDTGPTSYFDRKSTIFAAALYGAIGASMFMIEPLFVGSLMEHRNFSGVEVGSVVAAELAGNSLAAIAAMFWSGRVGWRIAASFGIAVAVFGNIATLYAETSTMLTTVRFLTAFFGLGVIYVLSLALISRTTNASRNFAIVIVVQATYGGIALLTIPQLAANWGIAAVIVPMAVLCTLGGLFVPLLPARELTSRDAKVKAVREFAAEPLQKNRIFQHWRVFAGLGVHAIWYLGIGALWAFVEVIGTSAGLDHASVGRALAICTVAGVSGALLASWFGDRAGAAAPFAIPVAAQAVLIWLFLSSSNWSLYLVAALMLQVTWNFALPYVLSFIARADDGEGLSVLIPAAQGFGVAIGPIIGGAIYDEVGVIWVLAFGSAISLISAVLFYPLGRTLDAKKALA